VSVKTDHHDKKHIVVNEGDTPITQSTKVVLAATKTRIIYCGFFQKHPISMVPNGEVLVIPKGRLESLSWALVWVPGQNL